MNLLRKFQDAREYMTPVLKASQFRENGVLTPEEFVLAGDLLVMKCPTWRWASGDPKKVRPYLPADKQYLESKGAPSLQRVSALETDYVAETEVAGGTLDDDGWLATHENTLGAVGSATAALGEISMDEGGDLVVAEAGAGVDDAAGLLSSAAAAGEAGESKGTTDSAELPTISFDEDGAGGIICGGITVMEDHMGGGGADDGRAAAMGSATPSSAEAATGDETKGADAVATAPVEEDEEYADLATFEDENLAEDDEATLVAPGHAGDGSDVATMGGAGGGMMKAVEPADTIVRMRRYDLSITYDKYYQTPRVWLFGYNEEEQPLTAAEIFEDVMQVRALDGNLTCD